LLQENYPRSAPIWFSESENAVVTTVLQQLTEAENAPLLSQVHMLIQQLCTFFNLTTPIELHQIAPPSDSDKDEGQGSDMESEDGSDNYQMEEDPAQASAAALSLAEEGIVPEGRAVLARLSFAQREQHLQGTVAGSVTATDRLMKELREIYKSEHYKKGHYAVELEKDSLYEWNVKLKKVDVDSLLAADMEILARQHNQDHLLFSFLFKDSFPFEPPFVRLVSPTISNGFVLGGGALCLELLTKQGWSSAYSVESVILQMASSLVKGKARIQFDVKGQYSLAKAQQSYKSLVQIHQKSGWYTPPKEDG